MNQDKKILAPYYSRGFDKIKPEIVKTSSGNVELFRKGEGEQLWGPMGKTALGGLLLSSIVTLVLVPTMYVILAKWQEKRRSNRK